jgi:hypothetical protein
MPTPTYTTPPTAPSRGDPTTFNTRFAAWLAWIATFTPELVTGTEWMAEQAEEVAEAASEVTAAAAVAADAAGLRGDSTTTLTVGAGNKDIGLTSAKASLLTANRQVVLILKSDASIKMFGNIAASPAPTSTTARVVVTSGGVFGSGIYSDWHVMDAAFLQSAATSAEIWAGTTDAAGISPKGITDTIAPVTIAYASTLVLNMAQGRYRRMTASASFTLGVPINAKAGQTFILDTVNSAGSIVLAVNAAWDRRSGLLGVLKPDNAARNKIIGIIDEVDGSGTMTRGTYDVMPGLA